MSARFVMSQQVIFKNGKIAAGALANFYEPGTSTRKAVYQDSALSVPHTNPVVADANGYFPTIYLDGTYKYVVTDSKGVTLDTEDNYSGTAAGDLVADLAGTSGASLVGLTQGGTVQDAVTWVTPQMLSREVDATGASDVAAKIQAAIDYLHGNGGGLMILPHGDYLIGGSQFINIKANVHVLGLGQARFISETGGSAGNHELVYMKDNTSITNIRLSGSDYMRQSGGADYIGYNKIGITTQGATSGNIRVSRVGFEKLHYSCVYVHDGHSDVTIEDCYTFGQQPGKYVSVDGSYAVTNWNSSQDAGALAAGTQVYCLLNFYNSGGGSGASNITIRGNQLTNINDAFVGVNGSSKRHSIFDNVFVKNADGYYGGWGADIYGGDDCRIFGNHFLGGSYGVHLYGSNKCAVFGNTIECASGIWIDASSQNNVVSDNVVTITGFTGLSTLYGINVLTSNNNEIANNTIDGNTYGSIKGIYFQGTTSGNRSLMNKIKDCATGVESADVNNDGNFDYLTRFNGVTTPYPRAINSNLFTSVKGISGTTANANNLSGSTSIVNANTSVAVTFTNAEPNTDYRIVVSVTGFSGAPTAGAYTITGVTSKTTAGFTLNVSAAPGVGNQVNFNWFLVR